MVARGEDDGRLAAAGVFQGAFCGLRSGKASAKMAFETPIHRTRILRRPERNMNHRYWNFVIEVNQS
jgi:hypothetical protein